MNELSTTNETYDLALSRESAAFELLQRQAKMLAASTLIPKDFQNNMANCAIGLSIAKRLNADPFMVIQNVDVIHGRPSFRASFLIAMVNASGRFTPLQFRLTGDAANRECFAHAKDKATSDIIEGPSVSMAMAKAEGWSTKAGSKWLTMPELMLRYRAAAFFARLYAPDITLGMQTAEEAQDVAPVRDVTPAAPPQATASKLFITAPVVIPVVESEPVVLVVESEPVVVEAVFTLQPSPPNRREILASKLNEHGMTWQELAAVLNDNGMLDQPREVLADCNDDELAAIGANWPAIAKLVKGARV